MADLRCRHHLQTRSSLYRRSIDELLDLQGSRVLPLKVHLHGMAPLFIPPKMGHNVANRVVIYAGMTHDSVLVSTAYTPARCVESGNVLDKLHPHVLQAIALRSRRVLQALHRVLRRGHSAG
jgi:hypothetical protein